MIQERIKNTYPAITLPEAFTEEDRGYAMCCIPELVLANGSANTDENDIKSAWMKLSDPGDTVTFELVNSDGSPLSTYVTPDPVEFPNEANAWYVTIPWADVLSDEGVGCYSLNIEYNIGGVSGTLVWGTYWLQVYSIESALGTARLRSIFNLNQGIEGINFTGSGVEDTIRFFGQIRKDQPNNEYEELLYASRRVETVKNENRPSWMMETDPATDELLRQFERLYLLSSNELFISDCNAHTNSYRIKDIPVSIDPENGPERDQPEKYSRQEVLTCKFRDRVQNKITRY